MAYSRLGFTGVVIIATTTTLLLVNSLLLVSAQDIGGQSFSLISTVKTEFKDDQSPLYIESREYYSSEQKRARIKFTKFDSQNGQIDFDWMVDLKQNIVLEYNSTKQECSLSSVEKIRDAFNFNLPETSETKEIDGHIVGPARVMWFVERHRSKMAYSSEEVVRNLNCLVYNFDYNIPNGGPTLSFLVFYSELSLKVNQGAHPVRVEMTVDGKPFKAFDFLQIHPLIQMNINQASKSVQVRFDPLHFELLAGCSRVLAQRNSIDLFQNQTAQKVTRFSFEASYESSIIGHHHLGASQASQLAGDKTTSFIAYDSAMRSMLVETSTLSKRRVAASSKRILNFELNRVYRIAKNGDQARQYAQANTNDGVNKFRQCTVTKLAEPELKKPQLTVGRLLLGADNFVYMGKALVRGIEATVYEAHNVTELPFWLCQSIVYEEKKTFLYAMQSTDNKRFQLGPDELHNREPGNLIRPVLVYFGEKDANHPLLLIEIYMIDSVRNEILARKSIQVNNFVWELASSADAGRPSDLFSLRDSCTDFKSDAAKLELLLKSDEIYEPVDYNNARILSSESRDLALLAGLQTAMRLPPQMVFDVETSLLNSTLSVKQDKSFMRMLATFNVAIHTKTLVRLIYVGQGEAVNSRALQSTRSFQDCFYLAAHLSEPVYFGYNTLTKTCIVDPNPLVPTLDPIEKPESFKLFEIGPIEVYRTNNYEDTIQAGLSHWTREAQEDQVEYSGRYIRLEGVLSPSKGLIFTILGVKKQYDSPIATPHKTKEDAVNLTGASFVGFGLPAEIEGNQLVTSSSLTDLTWIATGDRRKQQQQQEKEEQQDSAGKTQSMSFDLCHSACLSNFECQSFSVCIRNTQVECVISKTSFKSANVLGQLAAASKISALGRQKGKLVVQLDDQTSAELTRHPTCELHNKNFLDLFQKQRELTQNLRYRLVKAVYGRAGCAEMCLNKSLALIKQDASKNNALFESFDAKDKEIHSKKVYSIIKNHKDSMKQLCDQFIYLDRAQIKMRNDGDQIESRIRDLILMDKEAVDTSTAGGYCVVPAPYNYSEYNRTDNLFTLYFDMEVYEFKMDFFYEKQYGFGIKESVLTPQQLTSYKAMKLDGLNASKEDLSIASKLVDQGYNFVALLYLSPTDCARVCFAQSSHQLWPACRSFDIMLLGGSYWCQLNTLTMAQVRAFGGKLILTPNDTRIWHYEPRAGFFMDEAMLSGEIELSEASLFSNWQFKSTSGVRFNFFSCLLIILVGLASGIVLGLWLGRRLPALTSVAAPTAAPKVDFEDLIARTREVEFANQVSSNGQVNLN